jgi:hypothetical protein
VWGSIVKFDPNERWAEDFPLPAGGPPSDPEELKKGIVWDNGVFAPRIEKCYPGVISWLWGGRVCAGSTFDLDEYGRLYVPDAGHDALAVLDNAGNEVLRLAKTIPAGSDGSGPAINVGWPHRLACTRKAIYFGEAG